MELPGREIVGQMNPGRAPTAVRSRAAATDPLPASLRVRHVRELPEVLRSSECWGLLRSHRLGRLAVVVDGWPVMLTVNYAVDRDGLVIRTSDGLKLDAMRRDAQVAFQIDEIDPLYRSGWSVLVLGRGTEITAPEALSEPTVRRLEPWAGGERAHWVRIEPIQVTGRRVPRAWRYPDPIG